MLPFQTWQDAFLHAMEAMMTTVTEQNTITGERRERLSYVELGNIVLKQHGSEACQAGYQTTNPEWVGRYALQYGDIKPDGELT